MGFILALTVVVAVVGAGIAAVPAFAGDAVAQFEFDQSEQSTEPGETVAVDVYLSSDGGYADEGIDSYEFVVAVSPVVGEPTTDVEAGPWLARDGGTVDQTVERVGDGAIRVRHERTGAENGVTGTGVAATVTIDVSADALAADATVVVADTSANLHGSDYRMQSFGDEATVAIDGGGEALEPAYEPGTAGNDSAGVVTAEEANRSVDGNGGSGGNDDPTPGFGLGIGAVAIGVLLGSRLMSRALPRRDR